MKYFATFIFKDYMKWHILLNAILKENENYTIIGALRRFYAMMASTLLRENNQDIFLVNNVFNYL